MKRWNCSVHSLGSPRGLSTSTPPLPIAIINEPLGRPLQTKFRLDAISCLFIEDADGRTAYRQCCRLLTILESHKSDVNAFGHLWIYVKLVAKGPRQCVDAPATRPILSANAALGVMRVDYFEKVFLGDDPSQPKRWGYPCWKYSQVNKVCRKFVQRKRLLPADMFVVLKTPLRIESFKEWMTTLTPLRYL